MENIFIIAAIISVVYCIAKFVEMRFILKESKPLKFLIRDSIIVYFSVVVGSFIMNQMGTASKIISGASDTKAFIDNPDF